MDRQFVTAPVPGWAFCVSYASGTATETIASPTQKPRIDYREVLSEEHFVLFDRLRQLRTSVAEREAKQVYSVFTNAQLAAMVQGDMTTLAQLRSIKDVGESRCNNYGELFLQCLQQARNEQP